ncbi:MAG: hypothetical protein ABIK25_07375 [Pseudomonadota bacterium]
MTTKQQVAERDARIAATYEANPLLTSEEISLMFDVSVSTAARAMRKACIKLASHQKRALQAAGENAERDDFIESEYRKGRSAASIGKQVQLSETGVIKALRRRGVEIRDQKTAVREAISGLSNKEFQDRERAIVELFLSGISLKKAAREIGVTYALMELAYDRNHLRNFDPSYLASLKAIDLKALSSRDRNIVLEAARGVTAQQAATNLGVSVRLLYKVLDKHGIGFRGAEIRQKETMRNSRKIVRMLKGAKSGAQLANELGVFDKTVYRAKARVLNISSATKAKSSKPQRNVFCGPGTRNQMIADDYMQGMSSWGVGLKYRLGSAAVLYVLRRQGVKIRSSREGVLLSLQNKKAA